MVARVDLAFNERRLSKRISRTQLLLDLREPVNTEDEAVLLQVLDKSVGDPLLSVLVSVVVDRVAIASGNNLRAVLLFTQVQLVFNVSVTAEVAW